MHSRLVEHESGVLAISTVLEQAERDATHHNKCSKNSSSDFRGIVVIADGVPDSSKEGRDRAGEDEGEEEEREELSGIGLKARHKIDNHVEYHELNKEYRHVSKRLRDEERGWAI